MQDARRQRRLQTRIDDHPQRLTRGVNIPHIESRIIITHGANAGKDGAGARSPLMTILTRRSAGDPLTATIDQCGTTIQRGSDFHAHPGTLAGDARDETRVERLGLGLQQSALDRDASLAQRLHAARSGGIGVGHGDHHPRHTRFDERTRARWRAALMIAGLERDIGCRTTQTHATPAGLGDRCGLGMRPAGTRMPAFCQHRAVAHQHAADARIGCGAIQTALGQCQRLRHMALISIGEQHLNLSRRRPAQGLRRLGAGFLTSWMASRKSSTRWKSSYTEAKRI